VDQDLVDRVHEAEGFFGAELLGERCEAFEVTEHHRDLLAFALDLVALGEDLFRKALGQIALNLGDFVFRSEVLGEWAGFS
jgi:hypothetical protein